MNPWTDSIMEELEDVDSLYKEAVVAVAKTAVLVVFAFITLVVCGVMFT